MASVPNSSSARIVVVGAGAAGLACGWQLAKAGHDVTLVDRGEVGKGALWASGGMLAAGFEASVELDPDHDLAMPFANLLREGRNRWASWAQTLQSFAPSPLGFNQNGSITPAFGEAEYHRARTALSQAEGLDVGAQWLDPAQLARLEPKLAKADGAVLFPNDGQLDNRALGPALAGLVLAAGGRLEMRMDVKGLHRCAGCVDGVVLGQGDVLRADFVVLTTGAATLDDAPAPVLTHPVKGQMLGFADAGEHLPHHVVRGFSIYLCAKPGGRLIAGATVEPDVDTLHTNDQSVRHLLQAARRVLPGLQDVEPDERWAGLRPASRDLMPVIGEVEPGLIIAGGGYRNGVLLAPVMAEAVVSLVAGQLLPAWVQPFSPHRASLRARRDH